MKRSNILIFIVLLSIPALIATSCNGTTGTFPQPSGSDTVPFIIVSAVENDIISSPTAEETTANSEISVPETDPYHITETDVTSGFESTSAVPTPETTAKPMPDTTVKPQPETTVEPQPETTAHPLPDTTAEPETATEHKAETTVEPQPETTAPLPNTTAEPETTTEPIAETTIESIQETATTPTDTDVNITYSTDSATRPDSDIDWSKAVDGIYFKVINAPHCRAYVAIIKDPTRVYTATSSDFKSGKTGIRFWDLAERDGTVLMINAGEYPDNGGGGDGGIPVGITYSRGACVWDDDMLRTFMGFDKNNRLVLREGITRAQADELGIRDGVCFQYNNILIQKKGDQVVANRRGDTAVSQRTAIGQREDGAVIFLVTDGRTGASPGASYNDVIDIMLRFGAVNAGMLDGGSSSLLYYRDYYNIYNYDISKLDKYQKMGLVNKYKAFTEPRRIPTYFAVG